MTKAEIAAICKRAQEKLERCPGILSNMPPEERSRIADEFAKVDGSVLCGKGPGTKA